MGAARLGDVKETTLEYYRAAAAMFIQYLDEEQMAPTCAEEYDDLFVEWTHARRPNVGQVRYALAAIEFVYPRLRGKPQESHQRLDSLCRLTPPQHSVPCGRELAALLGAELATQRHARHGLGLRRLVDCVRARCYSSHRRTFVAHWKPTDHISLSSDWVMRCQPKYDVNSLRC